MLCERLQLNRDKLFCLRRPYPGIPPQLALVALLAEVQPDAVANDLGRKAVVLVSISRWCTHVASIAYQAGTGQATQQVDNASKLTMSQDVVTRFGRAVSHRDLY